MLVIFKGAEFAQIVLPMEWEQSGDFLNELTAEQSCMECLEGVFILSRVMTEES